MFFRRALSHPLKEGLEGLIRLPEIEPSTFAEFSLWAYMGTPEVPKDLDIAEVVELAILAEIYLVEHLCNQTSDILRSKLSNGSWKLTPSTLLRVHEAVPAGCILRRLCIVGLAKNVENGKWGTYCNEREEALGAWKMVFEQHADLGWDFFHHCNGQRVGDIDTGGICRFHIHKEVKLENNPFSSRCPAAEHGCLEEWVAEEKVIPVLKSKRNKKKDKKAKKPAQQSVVMEEAVVSSDDTLDVALAEETLFSHTPSDEDLEDTTFSDGRLQGEALVESAHSGEVHENH